MKTFRFFPLLLLVYSAVFQTPSATDTIDTSQIFRDGDTLISSGGDFAFGYFTPGASTYRYLGIWYNTITVQTVVWVANRISPLSNRTSGSLRLVNPGILTLVDEVNNNLIWSTNSSSSVLNPVAQLLDSGNLVIMNRDDSNSSNGSSFLWQSFDYPTDTLLPGMKLGWDLDNRVEYFLSSWKNDDDPSPGEFTYRCDPTGYPQSVLRRGEVQLYRTGPWDGITFGGTNLHRNPIYSFGLVMNDREVYYHYQLLDKSVISRLTLSQNGVGQRWTWTNRTQGWVYYLVTQRDNCDSYGLCGSYGLCNVANIPVCGCLSKFEPRDQGSWDRTDWSKGCVRRKPLSCEGDGFLKYPGLKLPDTRLSWFNRSMSLEECRGVCLRNCSCMAYSSLDVSRGESGCLLWFGDLIDIKEMAPDGLDLYIRMASSELESKGSRGKILLVALLLVAVIVLIGMSVVLWLHRRKKVAGRLLGTTGDVVNNPNDQSHRKDLDLPSFDLSTLTKATDNFWVANKLGEGGFGPVYKGLLEGGQEIAVKRLSRASLQGVDEFKNEVICIGKLQHRNLVKLLGYCIEGDENILVYEYMTNKSLDLILFDPAKSDILDWPKRFGIINGIARGLLYLHQDSRLRIIHRDLKASNILLDEDMNPKISDFGLARSFGGNETGANTSRVVGTYGYMSPEYAVDGLFSVKSDVFSFGVLLLEIVSGTRNRGFARRDHNFNLLGHAWMLHKDGRSSELVGFDIGDESSYMLQALRSIHVGLLCVQQRPEERPSMSTVVMMLGNNGDLPESKQPGFFTEREIMSNAAETSVSSNAAVSTNDMSITLLQPR